MAMKKELIGQYFAAFQTITRNRDGVEYWHARELQPVLGYAQWRNFVEVIERARTACANSGQPVEDHFAGVSTMVNLGSGAQREIDDIVLTRYACYLIAQNGDPRKSEIAFSQTYFALQTRKQEIIERRLAEVERLAAREKLTVSERNLSGIIYERVKDEASFARIRSKGDRALFGGHTTQEMKKRLGVPESRPLADFLPTITIKAKDFANEITTFNINRDGLTRELDITREHVKNNADVRRLLADRGICPESLPAAEDIKKLERRVKAEEKAIPAKTESLPPKQPPPGAGPTE
jgi:DNA-damage-inducible protein D